MDGSDGDNNTSKPTQTVVTGNRTRTSRGSPIYVDPSIIATAPNTWVRKTPPTIGSRGSSEVSNSQIEDPVRPPSPVDPQSARSKSFNISTTSARDSIDRDSMPSTLLSPTSSANWSSSQSPAPSIRLASRTGSTESKANNSPSPANSKSPPVTSNSPSPDAPPTSASLPKIRPNQSLPLLNTLFDQAHALIDQGEEDWAIANYDQLRHVIGHLFNSVALIRKLLELVKRIAPIYNNRHQEREATNRYKEVMYLAEKVGAECAAEQIELNLLVADSYIVRSDLALNDPELAVNIAAYANEAMWLCHTHKLSDKLNDCSQMIDLAEALFTANYLINTNIVLRLTQTLAKKPQEFPRAFKVVEQTLHQLFKYKRWLMIRKFYQSGVLSACTNASQKLSDDSYLMQMLWIQSEVNSIQLNPVQHSLHSPSETSTTNSLQSNSESNSNTNNSNTNNSNSNSADKLLKKSVSEKTLKPVPISRKPSAAPVLSTPKHTSSVPTSTSISNSFVSSTVQSHWGEFRQQLDDMRSAINVVDLAANLTDPDYMISFQTQLNNKLLALVKSVFDYCVEMTGDPPCAFSVFALGSLSRTEAGPYSDLEYGFLLADESRRESSYWKDILAIFEFTFICFGERVGFHTDDQGSPKTPTFRGTPAQLLSLFLQPMDVHDISTAFSMLRPQFVSSYPLKTGKELHDAYIKGVNQILASMSSDGTTPTYNKFGTFFLEDHLSLLPKWITKENDAHVELKTNFIQPMMYLISDLALSNGCYLQCSTAGVNSLLDLLTPSLVEKSNFALSYEFCKSIRILYLACYGLKVMAQLYYHEQFESDKVSITSAAQVQSNGNRNTPIVPDLTTFEIYPLTREQVYILRLARWVVLNPLFDKLPLFLQHLKGNTNSSSLYNPDQPTTIQWSNIDPVLDSAKELLDPNFNPYASSRPRALEETKELIRSLIATLLIRDAPISQYRHYYKSLAGDFRYLCRAAVTQHVASQHARVTALTYIFDAYAAPDGVRPLVERLKAHWREHISAMEPGMVPKAISDSPEATSAAKAGNPVRVFVTSPQGWPAQTRLRNATNEPAITTMKPKSAMKLDSNIGYEAVMSYLHFSCIGYGAPQVDLRHVSVGGKEVPVLFTEHIPGESLATVAQTDPPRLKSLDPKSFTEVALINMVLMCDGKAEDFVFEPTLEDPAAPYRLSRISYSGIIPATAEPIAYAVINKQEILQLKVTNIIFCLPQMLQAVNTIAAEDFLSLDPLQLMSRLIQDLDITNKDWKSQTKGDSNTIALLNKMVDPPAANGTASLINISSKFIVAVYDRIVRLQTLLQKLPKATHLDLLRELDPIVGQIYGEAVTPFGQVGASIAANLTSSGPPPSSSVTNMILDKTALMQAALVTTNADVMERHRKIQSKKDVPIHLAFTCSSSSPSNFFRLEKIRNSPKTDTSIQPTKDQVQDLRDLNNLKEEVKQLLLAIPASSTVPPFPREDVVKSIPNFKEQMLSSIDFRKLAKTDPSAKGDPKKLRSTILSMFDSVKFVSQLRIRHCPELDHQRLSKLLSGDTLKTLTVLDIRGCVGLKPMTLNLISSLDNLEYLNMSETDIKGISSDKFLKRETIAMDKLAWLNVSRSPSLQHILLRAINLRHLDTTGCAALTEVKILSSSKVHVSGLNAAIPGCRLLTEALGASWWYTSELVPAALERTLCDIASGKDKSLIYHAPMSESLAKIMAEVIKVASSLESIDFSKSTISGDEGLEAIITSAISNPCVISLDLSGCGAKTNKMQAYQTQAAARQTLKLKL